MFLKRPLFVQIFAKHVILRHLVRPNFLLAVVLSPFHTGYNTSLDGINLFVEIESDCGSSSPAMNHSTTTQSHASHHPHNPLASLHDKGKRSEFGRGRRTGSLWSQPPTTLPASTRRS
jgi:hypothetical protein